MATVDTGDDPLPGVADDELVQLDQLGEVPTPTVSGLVIAPELPEASRARLQTLGGEGGELELSDDLERLGDARLVLVSTRIPRAELTGLMTRLTDATCPVLALAHAGGESLAAEIVRRGGVGVVAEGNETSVASVLLGDATADTGLLDSYDRHVARTGTAGHGSRGRDPVTGLPDRTGLEVHLAELEQEGEIPRLAHVRVVRAPQVPEEMSEDAAALVRRRLAAQFLHVARAHDVAIFSTGIWDFALVGRNLSPNAVQYLGRDLDRIAATYSPSGVTVLGVAVGHAGSEVSTEVSALRESAQRALEAAVGDRTSIVIGADSLALGVSATTELESALQIVGQTERLAGLPEGFAAHVGETAAAIATALGYDGLSRSRIQLAAHLCGVGTASLPAESLQHPEDLTGEALLAYRQYPVRSAVYLASSAGPEVATAVRAHRERWDGTGFPDGISGDDIPISARVVATALAVRRMADGVDGLPRLGADLEAALEALAGSELDPDMVHVALEALEELMAAPGVLAVA